MFGIGETNNYFAAMRLYTARVRKSSLNEGVALFVQWRNL